MTPKARSRAVLFFRPMSMCFQRAGQKLSCWRNMPLHFMARASGSATSRRTLSPLIRLRWRLLQYRCPSHRAGRHGRPCQLCALRHRGPGQQGIRLLGARACSPGRRLAREAACRILRQSPGPPYPGERPQRRIARFRSRMARSTRFPRSMSMSFAGPICWCRWIIAVLRQMLSISSAKRSRTRSRMTLKAVCLRAGSS